MDARDRREHIVEALQARLSDLDHGGLFLSKCVGGDSEAKSSSDEEVAKSHGILQGFKGELIGDEV